MGKALFGALYVHPPLTDSEVTELEQLDVGQLSLRLHEERDAMTAWPAFDEGEQDMRTLVTKLRAWNKNVFMNAFVYSDSGGEGEEWLVIDDDIQSYYFGSGQVPEYIKPWLIGAPPSVRTKVPLPRLQRLTAHALRIAAALDVDELRALGESIPDAAHARALSSELHSIACRDFELSEAHWLDWRVRLGVLGVLVARIAFPESLSVAKTDFEDFHLTQGWLSEHAPEVATAMPSLLAAASKLQRRDATSLLLDALHDLEVELEPTPMLLTVALERTVDDYGPGYGFLIRSFGLDGVTRLLADLVARLNDYSGDANRDELRRMVEWHAFMCRGEHPELFASALKREPELAVMADGGAALCS